jgi:hypothetical protein
MTEYELTRRDALAALAAAGVGAAGVGAGAIALDDRDGDDGPLGDHELRTLDAVARAVYPSEVSGITEFVETYVLGGVRDRPERAEGIADAVAALDEYTRGWYDRPYADLDSDSHGEVLREMGVHLADPDPDPDATGAERVRFYLVNELLYALYTTPTGAELVGLENPQGHPGGTDSYRRGPE